MILFVEDLGRVALADYVERLLDVLEDDLAALLEASDLHLDDLADASLVVSEVLDALVVLDDARHAEVQAAEYDSLLDVLDEGQDVGVDVECAHIGDVSVNESIANALPGVAEYFVVQLGQALVNLAALTHIVNDVLVEHVHLPHLLVDLWQVLHILRSILNHRRTQWPLLPKLRIDLHQVIDLILFGVVLPEVFLQEVVQSDVDVSVVVLLDEVGY